MSTAGIAVLSALGVLSAAIFALVLNRRRRRKRDQRIREKDDRVLDHVAATIADENVEYSYESMPRPVKGASSLLDGEDDPYTSVSPPIRSKRGPLYLQDELDMAIDDRIASYESFKPLPDKRSGYSRDTVNL